MAAVNFDHSLSSMTLSELMPRRKAIHRLFVHCVKSAARYERHLEGLLRKIDMNRIILDTYREYGANAKIRRLEDKMMYLEERAGCYQNYHLHEVRECDDVKANLDMIDDAIMRCKATDSVEAEPLMLSVRLLSGDVLSIQADRSLRISAFADYFCKTHGYAPCATKRMTFMKKQEQEAKSSDELEDEIFWSNEIRREGEVMDDHVEDGDMLYLLIQPLEDPEWSEKFALFRRILEKEGRITQKGDEEIFSIYSTWLLTWIPPANTNRYIRLKAFVDENEDIFPIVEKK